MTVFASEEVQRTKDRVRELFGRVKEDQKKAMDAAEEKAQLWVE